MRFLIALANFSLRLLRVFDVLPSSTAFAGRKEPVKKKKITAFHTRNRMRKAAVPPRTAAMLSGPALL
jgi:hypothetical protein